MRLERFSIPDWRDPAIYVDLLDADRECFAWEWLRRDPCYRTAAIHGTGSEVPGGDRPGPERWGLHAFENPGQPAARARPMWTAARYRGVLVAEAISASLSAEAFNLRSLAAYSVVQRSRDGREHLLLSDGKRLIRVDVRGGSITRGRKVLRFWIDGSRALERSLLSLRRLTALARDGRFSLQLHRPEARAASWVLALRAADAIAAGACQREIAAVLLGIESVRQVRWREDDPNARGRAQRLVQQARRFASGGFWRFLA